MTLFAWLAAAVYPLAIRILIGLNIAVFTYIGLGALVNTFIQSLQARWGALPVVVAQIVALSGLNTAMGMILGALVARVAMYSMRNLKSFGLKAV